AESSVSLDFFSSLGNATMNFWIFFIALISAFATHTSLAAYLRVVDRPDELGNGVTLQDFAQSIESVPHVLTKRCRWKLCGTGRRFRPN
ncbi:hypothetical protein PMAYCL1PPCAC_30383, partial [Pristionchus mayeri]